MTDSMPTRLSLKSKDLPGFYQDASRASAKSQSSYLHLSRTRLIATVLAAVGGTFSLFAGKLDLFALLSLISFTVALIAEFILAVKQPERDWYSARALAESTKTLAWRYSVRGVPFVAEIPDDQLRAMLRTRIGQVSEKGRDRVVISANQPVITEPMRLLREASFSVRKAAYIEDRTREQRDWYAERANCNKVRADIWRSCLISCEIIAIVLAALRLSGTLTIDVTGILAASVASGAAWLVLKQHAQLASAYRVTARELTIQLDMLDETSEDNWSQAVADAEEAISREHTMWLASRGEK